MKAADCHACVHFKNQHYLKGMDMCKLGHKPRFYNPQTLAQAHTGMYGWKKRCNDFKDMKCTNES